MDLLLDSLCTLPAETYRRKRDSATAENLLRWTPLAPLLIYLGHPKSKRIATAAGEEYVTLREFRSRLLSSADVQAGDGWKIGGLSYLVHQADVIYDPLAPAGGGHLQGSLRTLPEGEEPLP